MAKAKVNFVIGTTDKWEQYLKIFDNSLLYDHYFKEGNFLYEWIYGPLEAGSVIIAETPEGEPVGLMLYDLMGMYAEFPYLTLLGVKEGYRSLGIGEQFVDIFFEICKGLGFDKCFIGTSDFNVRAKALYERKGFKPVVLVPDLIIEGVGEWLLMKRF